MAFYFARFFSSTITVSLLRMSLIGFFCLRFSAGLPLCDYSLDIEFWVAIREKILILFDDAELTQFIHNRALPAVTSQFFGVSAFPEGDAFYLRSTIRLKTFRNVKKLHKCQNRQPSGHFGGLCYIILYFPPIYISVI